MGSCMKGFAIHTNATICAMPEISILNPETIGSRAPIKYWPLPMQKIAARIVMITTAIVTALFRVCANSISILPAILSIIENTPVIPAIKIEKKKSIPTMGYNGPKVFKIVGNITKPISNGDAEVTMLAKGMFVI